MFVIPIGMVVMAVMFAVGTYLLARPKLLNENLMSSSDYIGGALIEVFLITFIEVLSIYIGMGVYNSIAAEAPTKLAEISTMGVCTVLTIVVLGAATPAYLFIRQLNKVKLARIEPVKPASY
jgi:hypothetical protein